MGGGFVRYDTLFWHLWRAVNGNMNAGISTALTSDGKVYWVYIDEMNFTLSALLNSFVAS